MIKIEDGSTIDNYTISGAGLGIDLSNGSITNSKIQSFISITHNFYIEIVD